MTDTTREAVERLAAWHNAEASGWRDDGPLARKHDLTATTLRALLAERDAAELTMQAAIKAVERANAERDAVRAVAIRALAQKEPAP